MNAKNISVTSNSFSFNEQLVAELRTHFLNVQVRDSKKKLSQSELIDYLSDSDGAIIGLDQVSKEVIDALPNLKIVSKYGVGLDNLNLEYLKEKNITVGWTAGINKTSVSGMALAHMINLSRNIYITSTQLKNQTWNKDGGRELSELTIGIVGIGHVGQDLIKKLVQFGSTILACDILDKSEFLDQYEVKQVSQENIFKYSDIISIHTPKTELTTNLINKESIFKMKDNSMVISNARGGIINEEDLYQALKSGKLHGAALDVYAIEPALNNKLFELDNFIGTPHIAGNSNKAVLGMGQEAIKHLVNFFN